MNNTRTWSIRRHSYDKVWISIYNRNYVCASANTHQSVGLLVFTHDSRTYVLVHTHDIKKSTTVALPLPYQYIRTVIMIH